jgi:small-conductance mechanosensitive channel
MKELFKTEIISTGNYALTAGSILSAVVIYLIALVVVKIVSVIITRSFRRKKRTDGRHLSIIQLFKYFVWTLAVVFVLQVLGLNITFLIASSAALLVGVGIGLQNVFKDFISGIFLLFEGTIKVNDIVEVDGLVVKVKQISIRTSKVTSREEIDVIIPNHKFIENNVVNWTHSSLPTRFMIEVGVDYASDPRVVEKVLTDCASSHKDIINDENHKPNVRLKNFGNSSIDFQLFFYSHNLFRIESTKSQIRFMILESFRKNKINIPFPQHVIHYANKE